ncbi:jacalin-like lectin [Streptomyces sp. UMAF16]|nr:jacalin-like lectin [Streptomyces sp. UMAF16]
MAYTASPLHGGSGGTEFRDTPSRLKHLTSITVHVGSSYVNGLQCTWLLDDGEGSLDFGELHGTTGDAHNVSLGPGEYIIKVYGRCGTYVDQLAFATNQGHVFGPFGGNGGEPFHIDLPGHAHVAAFAGRSGSHLDAISVLYRESVLA